MKLVTVRRPQGTQAARVEDEDLVVLPFRDVGELLASGKDWQRAASGPGQRAALRDAELAPTVTSPSKVVCLGLNYLDHIEEFADPGRKKPDYPTLFAKFAASLTGPFDKILLPKASREVDWEAELVVVIGKAVRNATDRQAVEAIAGYAVGNDTSMRDWQRRTSEFLQGKAWEASTPLGVMVTRDEVGDDGRPDLAISCSLDGEIMQNSRTRYLLFDCIEAVSYVSTIVTLVPGDLIFTGTCSGVGAARTPPIFIQPGQIVRTEIEGVGVCETEFYAEP